jgi:hypothetical protein
MKAVRSVNLMRRIFVGTKDGERVERGNLDLAGRLATERPE